MIDKLPTHPHILCTTPGCSVKTTCFGQNLEAKVKLVGSLNTFLEMYKCRACRVGPGQSLSKAKTKSVKVPRVTKAETRAKLVEEMISNIPRVDYTTKRSTILLRDSPDTVRAITANGSCIRPDIFLNSNRVCDHCGYNSCCQSAVKTFSKHYKP